MGPSARTASLTWPAAADSLESCLVRIERTLSWAEDQLHVAKSLYEDLVKVAFDGTAASGTLTAQERRVALLAASGKTNGEVAAILNVSPNTVKSHMRTILHKLDMRSRWQLSEMVAVARLLASPDGPALAPATDESR